jgi:hypothetical protein
MTAWELIGEATWLPLLSEDGELKRARRFRLSPGDSV